MEAHGLFAGASELRLPSMRYRFEDWGPPWATVLRRASQWAWTGGLPELARDLADWMAAAVGQLGPHIAADAAVRQMARRCLSWQAELLDAAGDQAALGQVRVSLRLLDELDGTGPGKD